MPTWGPLPWVMMIRWFGEIGQLPDRHLEVLELLLDGAFLTLADQGVAAQRYQENFGFGFGVFKPVCSIDGFCDSICKKDRQRRSCA